MSKEKSNGREINVKKTLENKFFKSVIGGNIGKSKKIDFGNLASQGIDDAYNEMQEGDEYAKTRKELQEKYNELGVYGTVDVSAISHDVMSQVRSIQQMATLGELEKYTKEEGADIEFNIPEELKEYSLRDIGKDDLDDKTKEGIQIAYRLLTTAYERSCVLDNVNYFADLNKAGKQFEESYKKEK